MGEVEQASITEAANYLVLAVVYFNLSFIEMFGDDKQVIALLKDDRVEKCIEKVAKELSTTVMDVYKEIDNGLH